MAAVGVDRAAVWLARGVLSAAARGGGGDQPGAKRRRDPALYVTRYARPERARKPGDARQLPADRGRFARLSQFADLCGDGDGAVPARWLSDRFRHRSRTEILAQPALVFGDPAVLDEPVDPSLCLDRDPAAYWAA